MATIAVGFSVGGGGRRSWEWPRNGVMRKGGRGGPVAVSYNAQTLPLSFLQLLWLGQHCANKAENCVFFFPTCFLRVRNKKTMSKTQKVEPIKCISLVVRASVHVLK